MTRRIEEGLLVLLGAVLPFWISASVPQATIARNAGAAAIGLTVALLLVILAERFELAFQSPIVRRSSKPRTATSELAKQQHAVRMPRLRALTNGARVLIDVKNADPEPLLVQLEAMELRGIPFSANLPWPMLWDDDGSHAARPLMSEETEVVRIGHQEKAHPSEGGARPTFSLEWPGGEMGMGEARDFTLRVLVHFANRHCDYAVKVGFEDVSEGDGLLKMRASAQDWDSR